LPTTPQPITYPITPLDCDFENGLCSWQNDPFATFSWRRNKGATISDNTGPLFDHTTQSINGHYIFADVIIKFFISFVFYTQIN
jgi:hypothetical protein